MYLPAIAGHVPAKMVQAIQHFMEFCSLVRRAVLDEDDLAAIDDAVAKFHSARTVFEELGVRPDLPSTTTLACPLPPAHPRIWCSKWLVFVNYRVQAHQSC